MSSQCTDRFGTKRAFVAASIGIAVCGVLAIGPAYAQRDAELEIDVADCVEIESPAERFRCYESRVDAALREQGEGEQGEAEQSEQNEARAGRAAGAETPQRGIDARDARDAPSVDGFGLRADEEEEEEEEEEEAEEEREELFGIVASLRETVPNSYIITLENGQVWRQNAPEWYPLRPGLRVRIYSTNWGDSYRLSAEELNGFIQVERVR